MAATRSCGLATEISPLPKTKIGKKGEQLTEKQQFRVTAVISWLSLEISPLPMNFLVKEERSIFRKLSNYLFQWANSNEQKIFRRKNFLQLAYNVWLPDAVADLATEFSPLAQNENSKKERTTYRKPAMSFASCYLLFFSFCFESKLFESIPIFYKHFFRVFSIKKISKVQLKFLKILYKIE